MKSALYIAIALFFCVANAIGAEKRIDSTLAVLNYNSIAASYMERPTFVKVISLPKGDTGIYVVFSPYRRDNARVAEYQFTLAKSHADDYLAMLDKFSQWAEQASASGDSFTKEIGRASVFPLAKIQFVFHSGNSKSHYLGVNMCSIGVCSDDGAYLDAKGVEEIRVLLNKLKNGELSAEDVGQKYN